MIWLDSFKNCIVFKNNWGWDGWDDVKFFVYILRYFFSCYFSKNGVVNGIGLIVMVLVG